MGTSPDPALAIPSALPSPELVSYPCFFPLLTLAGFFHCSLTPLTVHILPLSSQVSQLVRDCLQPQSKPKPRDVADILLTGVSRP